MPFSSVAQLTRVFSRGFRWKSSAGKRKPRKRCLRNWPYDGLGISIEAALLSFERATQGMNYQIRLRRLPSIEQHQIILPTGLLERVERHAVHFAQHGRRLLAAGRHLKRGILFHGRPGTGKTLTVMYLATQMRDRYCVSFCRIRIWAAVTDLSDGPDAATRDGRSGRCRLD